MRARAPGKVMISGAYSVLWGAPALVAAVDRYAVADTARPADHVGEELRAAIELGYLPRAPHVDVSALREPLPSGAGSRKLGLGSSAALLVASLAAFHPTPLDDEARVLLAERARHAHRIAQGGGSGVDVVCACFGGVLRATLDRETSALEHASHALPRELEVRVFAADHPAETSALVARVRAFAERSPGVFDPLLASAAGGARAAVEATSAAALVEALDAQREALGALGDLAEAPIVGPVVTSIARLARVDGAHFGPSGAGGGDVALHVGPRPPSAALRAAATAAGYRELSLRVGADGAAWLDGALPDDDGARP